MKERKVLSLSMRHFSVNYLKHRLTQRGRYEKGMTKREMFKAYKEMVEEAVRTVVGNRKN